MSSTWATRLAAAGDGYNLRLYFTIQGIANVFQEDAADVPATIEASTRPRSKLVVSIEQGETRLNLATRRAEGGSLTVRLQDDDSGTLAALFAPRSRRQGFVAANHSTSATTITISNTPIPPSTPFNVYIGAETIVAAGVSGTTLTGCTRAAFNSEAQTHNGDTTQGEAYFVVPPSWKGRRVYLTGYFVNDDGTTTSALSQALGVFMLGGAPEHLGDDLWQLSCVDLVEEFGNKKIGGGIFDVQLPQGTHPTMDPTTGNDLLVVGTGAAFTQFAAGAEPTYVFCQRDVGPYLDFFHGTTGTDTIRLETASPAFDISTVRHVAYFAGDPGAAANKILASRLGDAANGAFDVLPGADQTDFGGAEFRMGAGILSAEIDDASFTSVARSVSLPWSYIIDDEAPLSDFLFEFCLATTSVWGVSRSGKLTAYPSIYDGSASSLTITTAMIADNQPLTTKYAEDEIYPRVHLQCNYDITTKSYLQTLNLFDVQLQRRYTHNEASLDVTSKSLVISPGPATLGAPGAAPRPGMQPQNVADLFRAIQVSNGRGRAYASGIFHLPILAVEIGQIVTLSSVPMLDLEGSTSITSKFGRVIAMRPRYDEGEVDVTFELVDQIFRVAPAALISTLVGADVILQTTGPETASTKPARMFAVNDTIEAWDVSAGASVTRTVLAIVNDNRLTLSSAIGFTLDPGVDFIKIGPQGTLNTATSDDGYSGTDWIYQTPDDEYSSVDTITRWE